MININFNNGIVEDFTIVLSDRSHCHKGQIVNIDNFVYRANLNSANEISFTVYEELDGNNERLWDEIIDLRLVWIKELNEYFEIYVSGSETYGLVKNITGTSLCEAELSQTLLRNIEINTEDDIARDDYVVTKFYNSNGEGSLLHRILEKVPHYSIKHVDESLKNLQRTFSINDKSVYDFLTGECAEQFNCLFQFDSVERSISVYDLYTVCADCGHRGEFNDVCPECDGTDLLYYGTDTTIFVSTDNLTDEITYSTDVDSIKNCFKLEAGDDNMTAAVIACNPNGSAYLYYFSDEQKRDMPDALKDKLESYDELVESYTEEYQEVSAGLYDCVDKIIYYQSGMMPTIEIAEVTASTEAAKLTADNMNPIGLTTVSSYTSTSTVNSALKNFAKVFVKSGFVKVEIDSGTFTYVGKDDNGYDYGYWTGRFKITNYSDEEDVAYSEIMTIRVTSDVMYYLEQRIKKNIANNDSDDGSIFDVLSISNLDSFKNALTYYCYNRLESFADAIQGVIDILIEEKQSSTDSDYYEQFYSPYYDKLTACQNEMNVRAATIKSYEDREASLIKQRNDIQEALDFETYIGEELYNIFCSYRREDTYRNDNYISDGLDNAEILRKAIDFIDVAKQEIVKSGEHQHSMSANLYNLLVMKEFAPIKEYFELGNWIRCKFDDSIYRLRLVSYEISGNNLSSINTEFSDMTKTASGVNDLKSIIQDAASMASSYSYVAKQASQGDKAQNTLKDFVRDGLNSALINIKNNVYEEVTFDNHGIVAKSYDDISDGYSPEQLRITHNILAFTEDNWKTSSLGLGKHDYRYYDDGVLKIGTGYGLASKFIQAGYVQGSQIIGGEIYSQNYSSTTGTYINLNDGTFSWAGGKIKYDGTNLILRGVNLTWADIEDAPTKISEFENDAKYQNDTQVTQITKDTITAPFIKALNLEVGDHIKMGANATISWGNVTGTDNVANKNDIPSDNHITTITKNSITSEFIKGLNLEVGNQIKMGENATISWGKISDKPNNLASSDDIPTDNEIVNLILENRGTIITKDYIGTLKIVAGSVAAENITGTTIIGKNVIVGGESNGSGTIIVKDGNGATICTIDENGISVKSKSFILEGGIDIILGRYVNWNFAPNLVQYTGGYSSGYGTDDTSTVDGYVGGYGHTGSDSDFDHWGVDTGNIASDHYTTLKLSVYKSNSGWDGHPFPYLHLYGDGVLVKTYDAREFRKLCGINPDDDYTKASATLDITPYNTVRVAFVAEVNNSDEMNAWVKVGITALSLS